MELDTTERYDAETTKMMQLALNDVWGLVVVTTESAFKQNKACQRHS